MFIFLNLLKLYNSNDFEPNTKHIQAAINSAILLWKKGFLVYAGKEVLAQLLEEVAACCCA